MVTIDRAAASEINDVLCLYRDCGYRGGVGEADVVLVARMCEQLVGAVRLCPENDLCILRGMMVLPSLQRQGIGTRLLQRCEEQLIREKQSCYCIPYSHLHDFYEQAGFVQVLPDDVPGSLRERYQTYVAEGRSVILMYRPESS